MATSAAPMDLSFPIGKLEIREKISNEERGRLIAQVGEASARLREAVQGLSEIQLDTAYRPGGWTVRQVVHHLADSHVNSFVRFKLSLTEETPTIKTYDEKKWAEVAEARTAPVEHSLALLDALHKRWSLLLRGMKAEDFARRLRHPEHGEMTLDQLLQLYAWHGRHHVAHITSLRKREGWG